MKRLIILELTFLFLATTFSSNPPPGWYQQTLPVNDFVNDIFFLDSLNGWVVTEGHFDQNDTGHILHTSDGGETWSLQYSGRENLLAIQFLDSSLGYVCGGNNGTLMMTILKTTNGGNDWKVLNSVFGVSEDIDFINNDTGWICSSDFDFGGIWKTTNGGNNWIRQLSPPPTPILVIKAIFILNKDTGWAVNSSNTIKELYRTTNGGTNWNVQYTFGGFLNDVFFLNSKIGIITGGINRRTTDGGFSWISSTQNVGGVEIGFKSDSIGWAGSDFNNISKTTNGGKDWYYQTSPVFSNISISIFDTLKGWAAGTGVVKTTNGGVATSIENNITEFSNTFILYQNYPNPFNPKTVISYELRITSFVKLKVFDIQGREIKTLIEQRQNEGNYSELFDAKDLNSGIYFYKIEILDERSNEIYTDTRKMILIK